MKLQITDKPAGCIFPWLQTNLCGKPPNYWYNQEQRTKIQNKNRTQQGSFKTGNPKKTHMARPYNTEGSAANKEYI